MTPRMRRTRALTTGAALLALASTPLAIYLPADAADSTPGVTGSISGKPGTYTPPEGGTLGDAVGGLPDIDTVGSVIPTFAQLQAAQVLNDRGVRVTWGSRGTPESVLPLTGTLGAADGTTPAAGARAWLRGHADLLGITTAQVDALQVANDQDLITGSGVAKGSAGHVTTFQQVFGPDQLAPAEDGLAMVATRDGRVTYVSTSLARVTATMPTARLSPLQGWLKAAASVGLDLGPTTVDGIVPTLRGASGGGWTTLRVPGLADAQNARLQALALADGTVRPVVQATVVDASRSFAHTVLVDAVDGTVRVRRNDVFNADDAGTASTTVTPVGGVAPSATLPLVPDPKWRFFEANPSLDYSPKTNADEGAQASKIGCWVMAAGCTAQNGSVASNVGMGEWDSVAGVPTSTTVGNNANTHEAWASPLSPGGTAQAPTSPLRDYTQAFLDKWNNSGCDPTNLVPTGNDINAAVTNLFVGHNLFHDWAYHLGFTEANYNLQTVNYTGEGMSGDAEIGNVQAGALLPATDRTGELPVTGRDNANQIAEPDGVPGITNQYLFQPLAGGFYSPCADGSLDTSIYGHEYTHAISNRMVGGANNNLSGAQAGAMGESWSDLDAVEYQFAMGYSTGTNPFAVGAYATGNSTVGIRDYALDDNPLNYSDYGFDSPGPEVHADGEIWNAVNYDLRKALVDKYDAAFDYDDRALQLSCAKGDATKAPLDSTLCPGNRRWIQLVFDAWLLQQGSTSMLTARDAFLMADMTHFGGADMDVLWAAFARRGMGVNASTTSNADTDPIPSFATPDTLSSKNSVVTFTSAGKGKVYVGDYEARVTPVADTDPATAMASTATFTPGAYRMTYVSPDRGLRRFNLVVPSTGAPVTQPIDDTQVNLASTAAGGSVLTSTLGSINPASLIDGTEGTNWAGVTTDNVDTSTPSVAVDLAGTDPVMVGAVQVSTLLRPADTADADAASRFTALRKFAIETCLTDCGSASATWTTAYTSLDDAFPAVRPRPVAPNEIMRSFDFTPVMATAVRLKALENQCTGGPDFSDASGLYDDGGEPALDLDPLNDTDCATGSDRGTIVHASELQVFGSPVTPTSPSSTAPTSPSSTAPTSPSSTAPTSPSSTAPTSPTTTAPTSPTSTAPTSPTSTAPTSPTSTAPTSPAPTSPAPTSPAPTSPAPTTAPPKPGTALTRTRIRLPRVWQVRGKESTLLSYSVVSKTRTSDNATAGRVVVRVDGKLVRTSSIAVTAKNGKFIKGLSYRIPKNLAYGQHKIVVKFKPSDPTSFTKSTSRNILLTVVRTRP